MSSLGMRVLPSICEGTQILSTMGRILSPGVADGRAQSPQHPLVERRSQGLE